MVDLSVFSVNSEGASECLDKSNYAFFYPCFLLSLESLLSWDAVAPAPDVLATVFLAGAFLAPSFDLVPVEGFLVPNFSANIASTCYLLSGLSVLDAPAEALDFVAAVDFEAAVFFVAVEAAVDDLSLVRSIDPSTLLSS